jgi:hypothetical protein
MSATGDAGREAAGPLELADPQPVVAVQEVEYRRLLGYPKDHELSGRALELAEWARDWYAAHGRPWWYARQAPLELEHGAHATIDGARFTSSRLHDQLAQAGATSVLLVAVGAGAECEVEARRLWEDGKPDEYFFLEVYGSAVVEALVAAAAYRLCEWADGHGAAVLPHYSPGYPDWDIAEQGRLRDLICPERRGDLPGTIAVLPTGMLQPKKSLLAVYGLTLHVERVQRVTSLVPCTNCSLALCRYRRAPYRHPLRQIEAVHPVPEEEGGGAPTRPALTTGARYSVSADVLKRWSEQRLHLRRLGDGSVEARFRYDGTTCSDMGRPLAFDYSIQLGPREQGYPIAALHCGPAPGDEGHKFMCSYREDAEGIMKEIASEPPLLGHPLDAVLKWQRGRGVAGCYCAAPSREHKWGLALETLHWALAQGEAAAVRPPATIR